MKFVLPDSAVGYTSKTVSISADNPDDLEEFLSDLRVALRLCADHCENHGWHSVSKFYLDLASVLNTWRFPL